MDIKQYIKSNRERITEVLVTYLQQKRSTHTLRFYTDVVTRMQSFVTQGKMLRGVMVIMAAEMYGMDTAGTLDVAAAMELNQSSLLIHDDIMDQDLTRRGAPTIYAQYMDEAGETVSNRLHYGQSLGMCAGDIGFFMAFELLGRAAIGHDSRQKVIGEIATELQLCGGAQMADVRLGMAAEEPSREEILEVYRYKTGRYTFGLPLKIGAVLAGAADEDIDTLDELGEKLGVIFQLKDDEIKLFGTKDTMGADAGSDIRENKKTLIRHILFAQAPPQEKEMLANVFGNPSLTVDDIDMVKSLLQKHGIMESILSDINQQAEHLKTLVSRLKGKGPYRELLLQLIEYNVRRSA